MLMLIIVCARQCGWIKLKAEKQYCIFFGYLPNASKQELTGTLWYGLYLTAHYTVSVVGDCMIKCVDVKPVTKFC